MSLPRLLSVVVIALLACGDKDAGPGAGGSGGGSGSGSGSDSVAKVPASTAPSITVAGSKVTVNGVEVSTKPMMADIENILGTADRTWGGREGTKSNKIYTWDKLGVVAYEPPDHPGRCISTTFPFRPMGTEFSPKEMFSGTFTIEGKPVTKSLDIATAKAIPGATQPYGADSIVFDKGEIHVFTNAKGAGSVELLEVSYWQTPKDAPAVAAVGEAIPVTVTGSTVSIKGVEISSKPLMADVERILGKADRTWGGGTTNKVHTWDKLGVIAYEAPDGQGRCISTTFPYKPMSAEYSPKAMFGGTFTVDGQTIPSTIDIATIKARPGASQPYGADSIVFDKGEIHVFTNAKGSGPIELVEVSYWQKPKAGADTAVAIPSGETPLYAGTYRTSEGAMTLKQSAADPTTVTGSYAKGSIKCKATGDVLTCNWYEGGPSGRAKFKRAASGNMNGTWGSGGNTSGGGGWSCTLTKAGVLE